MTVVVMHRLVEPDSSRPIAGYPVPVRLVGPGFIDGPERAEILDITYAKTDDTGLLTLELVPNALISPAGTGYLISVGASKWAIVVPDTAGPVWLADILATDPVTPGVVKVEGVPGASAYQLAVTGGFVGTETEWLASLAGSGSGTTNYLQLTNRPTIPSTAAEVGAVPTGVVYYNVRDFGAVGDNYGTDDTAAIQMAIDASAAGTLGGAGLVYFPAGRYRITSALTVPPACAGLIGAGADFDGTAAASMVRADVGVGIGLLVDSGGKKQRLQDFTLTSAANGLTGSDDGLVVRASRLRMDNITVARFGRDNIYFDSLTAGASCSVATITGCRSTRAGRYGWLIESNDANAGSMSGCDTVSNKGGGMYLKGASRWDIHGHFAANGGIVTGGSYAVRGPWYAAAAYAKGDIVNSAGTGYIALAVPTIGVAPSVGAEWILAGFAIFDDGIGNHYNPYIESGIGHRIVLGPSSTWGVLDSVYYGPGRLDYSLSPASMISWTIRRYNAQARSVRIYDPADEATGLPPTNVVRLDMGVDGPGVLAVRREMGNKKYVQITPDADEWQYEVPVVPRATVLGIALGSLTKLWQRMYVRDGADGGLSFGSAKPIWTSGSGTPEGAVTARIGSLFTRQDAPTPAALLYVKATGTGTTGWVPVPATTV